MRHFLKLLSNFQIIKILRDNSKITWIYQKIVNHLHPIISNDYFNPYFQAKYDSDRSIMGVILGGIRSLWATRLTEDVEGDKDLYVRTTLRELFLYLIFLINICIMTLGNTSTTHFYFTNVLQSLFLTESGKGERCSILNAIKIIIRGRHNWIASENRSIVFASLPIRIWSDWILLRVYRYVNAPINFSANLPIRSRSDSIFCASTDSIGKNFEMFFETIDYCN